MKSSNDSLEQDHVRSAVRTRYAAIAGENASAPASQLDEGSDCCAPSCCDSESDTNSESCGCAPSCCGFDETRLSPDYVEKLGYSAAETASVPEGANLNLGCGNPVAIASIQPGETVVDLGSGAGFDCFLAANQLNGTGKVIGIDMTPAMISKARANSTRSKHANVEFRLGEIEALPVADTTADLVISNCVINLSPDKPRVFREAFRILKSGGRLSISDIVARAPIPAEMRENFELLTGCVAGAETVPDMERWLREAGFADISIVAREESREMMNTWSEEVRVGDYAVSALIQAHKP